MTDTDEAYDETDNSSSLDYLKNHFKKIGHVYALMVVFLFTIYTRMQGFRNLQQDNGSWLFTGNDAWYHFRATMYNVENYPFPIGFDAKTGYPNGADPGTFGTLYDFVHASISMIFGLGNPSPEMVQMVLVVSSPILSGIAVLVAYSATKYITGSRLSGVLASLILAFIPGTFYARGTVGFAQHHIAEAILLLGSLILVMKAVQKAEEDLIIGELIRNKEISELRSWGLLVGASVIVLFMYYLTWPPAIMLFGLIGLSGVLYSFVAFSNRTTQSASLTFTILTGSMVMMILVSDPVMETGVAKPSLLHIAVAVTSFFFNFLCWTLLRRSNEDQWSLRKYSSIIGGAGLVLVGGALILQPSIAESIFSNVMRLFGYPFGLGSGGGRVQTIAEEQSATLMGLTFRQYGLMLYAGFAGVLITIYTILKDKGQKEPFGEKLLFVFVSVFIFLISLGTVRFNYYLAPFVAILASIAILRIIRFIEIPSSLGNLQGYHVLGAILIVMLFAPVLLVPVQGTTVYQDSVSESQSAYEQWEEPLNWLSENSPEDGIGQYESTSEPYTYPEESYGVMSWWDYGHWITVTGERTPVANPFQQNAQQAAEFLLAQNPDEAEQVMNDMGEDKESRYIIIDWQMASPLSKYPAMEEWHPDMEQGDSYRPYYTSQPGQSAQLQFMQRNQMYYESMIGRLYVGHGSAMESSTTTIDYNTVQSVRTIQPSTNPIVKHNTTEEARNMTESETQISRGGIAGKPPERVEALEQYRLVKTSSGRSYQTREVGFEALNIDQASSEEYQVNDFNDVPSTVKIFEHVDGADIQVDNVEANEEMTLEVDVRESTASQSPLLTQFTYTQRVEADSEGVVEATVPYSNTGYDQNEFSPEVRGVSQYRLLDSEGNVVAEFDVPESNVVNDTDPVEVSAESGDNSESDSSSEAE